MTTSTISWYPVLSSKLITIRRYAPKTIQYEVWNVEERGKLVWVRYRGGVQAPYRFELNLERVSPGERGADDGRVPHQGGDHHPAGPRAWCSWWWAGPRSTTPAPTVSYLPINADKCNGKRRWEETANAKTTYCRWEGMWVTWACNGGLGPGPNLDLHGEDEM